MPIDFPNNPSSGQTYSYAGQQWSYDGVAWNKIIIATIPLGGICGSIQYNDGASGLSGNSNFYYDGTNVVLIDPTHLDGDILGGVHHYAHNDSGVGITRGWPVYITGMDGASTIIRIATADASDSSKMPAVGLAESDIADGAFGHITMFGTLLQTDTSGYATNQTLYVAPGGGLTSGRPSASNQLIQNIGKVGRVHPNTGSLIVMGPGRSNDVPNIVPVRSWLEMPSGQTATSIVTLFNGLSGPVTGVNSVRGVTGAVGITNGSGIGISVSGQTMTFSNTGVLSIDGGTGAITNVARTNVNNNFSASQIIGAANAYLTVIDTTLNKNISINPNVDKIVFYDDNSGNDLQLYVNNYGNQVITFPDLTCTVAGRDISQTFTALQTFSAGISAAGATFSGLAIFNAGISAAGGTFSGTQTFVNGATFQGNINAPNIVTSFNGSTGAIVGVNSVRGLTGAVGITNGSGIGLSVSGQTMTFSNTGVLSIDGGTGAITNVARTNVDNNFSASQTISTANAALTIVDSSSFNEVSFQGEFNRLYFYNDLSGGEVFFGPTIAPASTITVALPNFTTTLAGLAGTQTFTGTNTFSALTNFPGGISAAGATFSGNVQAATYTETSNRIRVTNNARSWFL